MRSWWASDADELEAAPDRGGRVGVVERAVVRRRARRPPGPATAGGWRCGGRCGSATGPGRGTRGTGAAARPAAGRRRRRHGDDEQRRGGRRADDEAPRDAARTIAAGTGTSARGTSDDDGTAASERTDDGDGPQQRRWPPGGSPTAPPARASPGRCPARPTGRPRAVSVSADVTTGKSSATLRGRGWAKRPISAPSPNRCSLCHTRRRRVAGMARTRTIYRCSECGAAEPKWTGRCPACEAWNTLVEEVVARAARAEALGPARPPCPLPIAEVDTAAWAPAATDVGELDRVLRGGLVPGLGHPARRRAGHRQVHAAAAGAGRAGQGRPAVPLRHGRGVGPAGAAPGRAARRAAAATCGSCPRPRCPHVLGAHRRRRARRRGDRLDPDGLRPRRCRSAPGSVAQVRECAHRLVPASKERAMCVGARRPRHQGRRAGRAAGARAPRRHRAVLRGRAPPRPAPAAGGQAPLRLHRRARPVRDDRRRARGRARPVGAVPRRPAPRHARLGRRPGARRAPPAARRGAGARRAIHRSPRPAGPPRASTAAASRWSLAVLEQHVGMPVRRARRAHRGRRRGDDGRAGGRPRPRPGPRLGAPRASPCPPTSSPAARSASAASSARCTRPPRRLAEAARLGFRRAVVPAARRCTCPASRSSACATLAEAVAWPAPTTSGERRAS